MISTEILNRKGAVKSELIPDEILVLLNRGVLESVNLTEWSAVDHAELIKQVFPDLELSSVLPEALAVLDALEKPSTMKCVAALGHYLFNYAVQNDILEELYLKLSSHQSDSIRCYACYLVALQSEKNIEERLTQSRNLIADSHFGVREIIWMALRPQIVSEIDDALVYLESWTTDTDERIRRFTTEVTRPKGVWTQSILALKLHPEKALPLLDALKSDPSLYVQNSVGNWLNDASKSKPKFVADLCSCWLENNETKETKYIVKRALRSLKKEV